MKIHYPFLLIAMLVFVFPLRAQYNVNPQSVNITGNLNRSAITWQQPVQGLGKTTACGYDTVNYTFNKATSLQAISMTSTTATAFAQWYSAPQTLSVSGFEFFAWQSANINATVSVTCRIYNASPIDSTPTGLPLATVVVPVDSTFGGGQLVRLRKLAVFPTPVTVSGPYVLTVESNSATQVSVVTNYWAATPPNGRSEWLSSLRFNNNFVRSYNVNVGGIPFNADFVMQPFVSTSITADFTPSTICNQGGGNTITFTNTSSPINFDRMYSVRAYQNIPQFSFMWNYGDHAGFFYAIDGSRAYFNRTQYTVTLTDTLIGWTRGCSDIKQRILFEAPLPPVVSSNTPLCLGSTLQLTCDSVPGATSYYWTGPNGFSSNQRNPTVTNMGILSQGNYNCVVIMGQCTSAVSTASVSVINTPVASNNGPICEGQQLVLSISNIPGATYSWTGPNNFSSTNINPVKSNVSMADSGMYSVTVTSPGCGTIGPYPTQVVIKSLPQAPVASSNTPICVGDNLQLNATNVQGANYNWIGPNGFNSSQQNPVRLSSTLLFAGTYSVTVNVNGCTSAPANTSVTVNPIPATPVVSSNAPLCVGQTLSLTATPVNNATYQWSGPANFNSTQQNPTRDSVLLFHSGTYSVVATVNGCASAPGNVNVQISTNTPTPVVTNNGPLCPGQTLQLNAGAISGATYNWSGPNGFTSNVQNPSILNVDSTIAGLYSVTAITPGCAVSSAGGTTVIINSLSAMPTISSNAPICEGSNLQLNASSINGATYFWSGPDGFTSNNQNPVINNASTLKAGQYSVYVNVQGCGTSNTANYQVIVRRVPMPPSVNGNSPVCTGDTIRFSASSNTTGLNRQFNWSGPNNFSSNLPQPILPNANNTNVGNYTVTVSDSGCTSQPASYNLMLKQVPNSPVAGNSGEVCEEGNLQLTATTIAGASYKWSGPNGYVSFQQNPVINKIPLNQSGTYQVEAIVNGCSSLPAATTVSIKQLPATPTATNSGAACVGGSVTLSTDIASGMIYSWKGPNNFVSTDRTPIINNINANQAGSYEVVLIDQGCISKPGTTQVQVNPIPNPPVITSLPIAGSACSGDSIMLFASFLNGGAYEWAGPAGFGSTTQNIIIRNVSTINTGDYSVKVTKAGCTSNESIRNITVNPAPQTGNVLGAVEVRSQEVHNYTVQGTNGSIFNWTVIGGTQTSGGTTSSISVTWGKAGTGKVMVRETNVFGCVGLMKETNVQIGFASGLDMNFESHFKLYPNPVEGKLFVELHVPAQKSLEIKCYNSLGQLVNSTVYPTGLTEVSLDTEGFVPGVYLVSIEKDGAVFWNKILHQ